MSPWKSRWCLKRKSLKNTVTSTQKKTKFLITGANGLLGQKLVELLEKAPSVRLIATGRGTNRNPTGDYTYLPADLTRHKEVNSLIREVAPDVIIHAAAMTQVDDCELHPEECDRVNIQGTKHLLDAHRGTNTHFIYVSTDFVFDGEAGPYAESDLPNPISHYGRSKLRAEELVKNSGTHWSIIRTVLVYGVAHDPSRSNLVLWVKKSLEAGKHIKVVNDQWRTPTLAEDLAMGCRMVAKQRIQGIFHLSGEETFTPYEMALRVAAFFDLDRSLITAVDASTFSQPGKRPPRTGFVIDKAKKELGFHPKSFSDGLKIVSQQL